MTFKHKLSKRLAMIRGFSCSNSGRHNLRVRAGRSDCRSLVNQPSFLLLSLISLPGTVSDLSVTAIDRHRR